MNNIQMNIKIFVHILLVYILVIVISPQATAQATESTESSTRRLIVLPLLESFPTLTIISSRDIYNRIRASVPRDIRVSFGQDINIGVDKIPRVINFYMDVLDYDFIVFVDTIKNEIQAGTTTFTLNLWVYAKGMRAPIINKKFESKPVKSNGQSDEAFQKVDMLDINQIETIDELFTNLNTAIQVHQDIEYATIVVNPGDNIRPEFILRVNEQTRVKPNLNTGEATIEAGDNEVVIYQVLHGEELKIDSFITSFSQKYYAREVTFINDDKNFREGYLRQLHNGITLLMGLQTGISITHTNIFNPSYVLNLRYTRALNIKNVRNTSKFYTGVDLWYSPTTNLDIGNVIIQQIGLSLLFGGSIRIAQIHELSVGGGLGGMLLFPANNTEAVTSIAVPSLNIDAGYAVHVLVHKKRSIKIMLGVTMLNVVSQVKTEQSADQIQQQDNSNSIDEWAYYFGIQPMLGIGITF